MTAGKDVATPKETAGGGFRFENRVGAYYACRMLQRTAPSDPAHGCIVRIDFQTRASGWYLDDILLTLETGGTRRRYALSVKSNRQFTTRAVPSDFAHASWAQFLGEGSNAFDPETDMLGLVTAPHADPPKTDIQNLLAKARQQEPTTFVNRLPTSGYASAVERALFKSFQCPQALAQKHRVTPAKIGALLKRIIFKEFDFEHVPSEDETNAIRMCQGLLTDGSLDSARRLWCTVLEVVDRVRTMGGYLDTPRLVRRLTPLYDLRDFPDFAGDWDRICDSSRRTIEQIPCQVGGTITMPRKDTLDALSSLSERSRAIAMVGSSGVGKTVAAKLLAEQNVEEHRVVWLTSDQFGQGGIDRLAHSLGMQHSLCETLANLVRGKGLVVLDGLERLHEPSEMRELAATIKALDLPDPESPWLALVTCQSEHWPRVLEQLTRYGVSGVEWQICLVAEPSPEDLCLVWVGFPHLRSLLSRPHLSALLGQPKVLDLLALRSGALRPDATAGWTGESDLIDWYWDAYIRTAAQGDARASFLQRLAEKQADEGRAGTPVAELEPSDLTILDGLRGDGVCCVREERIYFSHDLLGDWARQRRLLASTHDLPAYLRERVAHPHWHRAVRLLGLRLLEKHEGTSRWRAAMADMPFAQDLLLDALVFAANPEELLEQAWLGLVADNGVLLRRFLTRFLHVATYPNQALVALVQELGEDNSAYARLLDRVPLWPYWPAILRVLRKHIPEVVELAPLQAADVAHKWLKFTQPDWERRVDAASIALSIGESTYQRRVQAGYRDERHDHVQYAAMLASAPEFPDQVIELALKACARVIPEDVASGQVGDYREPGATITTPFPGAHGSLVVPEPWPDGPRFSVDAALQRVCLTSDALGPLMRTRPEAAKEAILALLIERPTPKGHIYEHFPLLTERVVGLQHICHGSLQNRPGRVTSN